MQKLVTSAHVLCWIVVGSFVVASAAYGLFVPWVSRDLAGLALALAGSVAAYALALVLLGAFGRDDIALLRGLLPGLARKTSGGAAS